MIIKQLDGYFENSINAWRDLLMKRQRQLMTRYTFMEKLNHPSTYGQGVLIDINKKLIQNLDREYRAVLDAVKS